MKMRVLTIKTYVHLISLCMLAALQPASHHPEVVCVALDVVRARDWSHGGSGCRGFAHVGADNHPPRRTCSDRAPPGVARICARHAGDAPWRASSPPPTFARFPLLGGDVGSPPLLEGSVFVRGAQDRRQAPAPTLCVGGAPAS